MTEAERRDIIRQLYEQGWSVREIAAHPDVGLKHARVAQLIRELELPPVQVEHTADAVIVRSSTSSPADLAETVARALRRTGRQVERR